MLADPSDCEDYSAHEAPHRPIAVLTKFPTRLPFRTPILSKGSETTHSVLPQYGQGGPRANSGDFTHPSTTKSVPGNRRPFQSIANVPLCPIYISPETSYGNQSPVKLSKNPPSLHLATISTTSSRDTRLLLL